MKKKYVKPTIILESFVLTQSIAHNCGDVLDFSLATLKYKGQCGWDPSGAQGTTGLIIFMEGQDVCTRQTEEFAGVCYNNPGEGYNVFNS